MSEVVWRASAAEAGTVAKCNIFVVPPTERGDVPLRQAPLSRVRTTVHACRTTSRIPPPHAQMRTTVCAGPHKSHNHASSRVSHVGGLHTSHVSYRIIKEPFMHLSRASRSTHRRGRSPRRNSGTPDVPRHRRRPRLVRKTHWLATRNVTPRPAPSATLRGSRPRFAPTPCPRSPRAV